jgi:hypothetical protein
MAPWTLENLRIICLMGTEGGSTDMAEYTKENGDSVKNMERASLLNPLVQLVSKSHGCSAYREVRMGQSKWKVPGG